MNNTSAEGNVIARVGFELLIHMVAVALVKGLAWAWSLFKPAFLS